jgi:hypothetical protein
MAYEKTQWVAPQGTNLNKFDKQLETATSVNLVPNFGLTNTPTPQSVENFNKIEQGIYEAHTGYQGVLDRLTEHGDEVDGCGRNLLDVLGVSSIPAAMAALRVRCNGTGVPNFKGLMVGDYLDGINLSAIPLHGGGTAGQAWNNTYKNNRIVISGFNTFKGAGDIENSKNHILFTFRNVIFDHRMNPTDDNTGGYTASELRVLLEGANGDGSGVYTPDDTVPVAAVLNAFKAQIGDYVYTIQKYHSLKSNTALAFYSLWLPSEFEVSGSVFFGDEGVYMPALTSPALAARVGLVMFVQFPIFSKGYTYRIKRYNGVRAWWWELTPYASTVASFCNASHRGYNDNHLATVAAGGVSPAFCVA